MSPDADEHSLVWKRGSDNSCLLTLTLWLIVRDRRWVQASLRKLTYGLDQVYVRIDNASLTKYRVALAVDTEKNAVMSSESLQTLMARCSAELSHEHPDYLVLAGRLETVNIHRAIPKSFRECVLQNHHAHLNLYDSSFLEAVGAYGHTLDGALRHDRDMDLV
ncbi:hypothetical protein C8Q76DRAFT_697537 [Earliella scabrosa]|nr:hypothetical protein C8Q76DRAFT_697537 [Earliella scabrosa]